MWSNNSRPIDSNDVADYSWSAEAARVSESVEFHVVKLADWRRHGSSNASQMFHFCYPRVEACLYYSGSQSAPSPWRTDSSINLEYPILSLPCNTNHGSNLTTRAFGGVTISKLKILQSDDWKCQVKGFSCMLSRPQVDDSAWRLKGRRRKNVKKLGSAS